ncbi:MAG: hypothetical protein ACFFAY_05705 [Promethearchaeota archaeon]
MVREVDCVRTLADEILRGPILSIDEPITHIGIAVIPIIATKAQYELDAYLNATQGRVPVKCTLTPAIYFSSSETNRPNGNPTDDERERIKEKFIKKLPGNTCGVLVMDSQGMVVALSLNLQVRTFWLRIGQVVDLICKYYNPRGLLLDKMTALVSATLFLARLRGVDSKEVIATKDWGNIMIGLPILKEETDENVNLENMSKSVLYCSIGIRA